MTILLRLPAQLSVTLLRFRLGPVSGFPLPCLSIRIPYLVPSHRQELMGPPKFLLASLPACHGLWTPADLPILALSDGLVLPSADVKPLGIRINSFRSCTSTSGCAVTPAACRILCLRFAHLLFAAILALLRIGRKTRYGWLAKPYPTGTFTLQDTPSFLGATTTKLRGAALVTRPLERQVSQMLMEQHTSPAFLRRGGEGLARAKGFPGGCGDSPRCKRH